MSSTPLSRAADGCVLVAENSHSDKRLMKTRTDI